MSGLRVLVSGASVAGPSVAYWLARAGCRVTLVERAPSLRSAGQGIDIKDSAREIVKRMGIFERVRELSSQEEGTRFVDGNNHCFASWAVDPKMASESGHGGGLTSDIEILRGDLAKLLFEITKENVNYIFDDEVQSLEETTEEVRVQFSNGSPQMTFDLVIAADGVGSKIRGMALGGGAPHIKSMDSYVAYFSIPPTANDSLWSRVHWCPGGRLMVLRPDNVGRVRAFLGITAYEKSDERLAQLAQASKGDISTQKALMQKLFKDADWEASRILNGMHDCDDFYLQHVAQVRLDRWSSGRVTVVGDAGYAPTPFTGMGTSLAFIGAYILAGEISQQPNNIPAALESYDRILRKYVEDIQTLAPGVPWIVNPQSAWGVKVLQNVLWTASKLSALGVFQAILKVFSFVFKIFAILPERHAKFQLPDYKAFK